MPSKRRRSGRGRRARLDRAVLPTALNAKEGTETNLSVKDFLEAFDQARPFRISAIWGVFSSYGTHSVPVQIEAYGVGAANLAPEWVAPLFLAVPNGRSFRYSLPVAATLWYPAHVAKDQVLLKIRTVCVGTSPTSGITGVLTVEFALQPREVSAVCPKVLIGAPAEGSASTSAWSLVPPQGTGRRSSV